MGIKGNILDLYNSEQLDTNAILAYFAEQCIAAYRIHHSGCKIAAASMNAKNRDADLFGRINSIVTELMAKPILSRQNFSLYDLGYDITMDLGDPAFWIMLEQKLGDLVSANENSAHRRRSINQRSANDRFPSPVQLYFSQDPAAFVRGGYNIFMDPAVKCLDANYEDINNVTSFVKYISELVDTNVWNFEGVEAARCLSWPDLTAFNVERFRQPVSPKLKNKIIVIGITHNAWHSYSGALSTYNYFGENNSVFLIHDAVGRNSQRDPNQCTTNALTAYFLKGNGSVGEVNL